MKTNITIRMLTAPDSPPVDHVPQRNDTPLTDSHKNDFLKFMQSFVESYNNRGSSLDSSLRKSVRFSPDTDLNAGPSHRPTGPFSFGCPAVQTRNKNGSRIRSNSHDPSLVSSLRSDNNSNNLAETFLQLAGLSQNDTSDLFKKVNARKSGEHRKASDIAPIQIKWPQELLDRPAGKETGYNELSLAEFMSGNLGLINLGLPNDPSFDFVRNQIHYFRTLCDDAVDYSWPLVREAHKAVLLALEQGLLNPDDLEGMLVKKKLCLERAFRHKAESNTSFPSTLPPANRTGGPDKTAPGFFAQSVQTLQ